jgi:hypothetical protein
MAGSTKLQNKNSIGNVTINTGIIQFRFIPNKEDVEIKNKI